jgi:hypothetical protein
MTFFRNRAPASFAFGDEKVGNAVTAIRACTGLQGFEVALGTVRAPAIHACRAACGTRFLLLRFLDNGTLPLCFRLFVRFLDFQRVHVSGMFDRFLAPNFLAGNLVGNLFPLRKQFQMVRLGCGVSRVRLGLCLEDLRMLLRLLGRLPHGRFMPFFCFFF